MSVGTWLALQNDQDSPVQLFLEPWAEEYTLAPRARLHVHGSSREAGFFEVSVRPDRITIWAWSGSTVRLFVGDEELGAELVPRPVIPLMP